MSSAIQHSPGVYFNLDERAYRSDPALGSTMIKLLRHSPSDFWWQSQMNPVRPEDKETPARQYGRALHSFVLEGEDVFNTHYATAGAGTVDELRQFCVDHGIYKTGLKDQVLNRIRTELGFEIISNEWWREIQIAAAMILKNPNLMQAFTNGAPEVSVFWVDGDVRLKARFDYLKLKAVVDLKSIRLQRAMSFDRAVFNAIANYRYDLQAAHYLRGRAKAAELIKQGQVFGEAKDDWLQKLAESAFTFIWVFYKADGAPIAKGYEFPVGHPNFDDAAREVDWALNTYRECLERYGTEMWVNDEPIHRIDREDLPAWMGM